MKKEIPRMLRSATIVYAFDFLGTLFSCSKSFIFSKFNMEFNPDKLGIRWIMLIPDSRYIHWLAKRLCLKNELKPSQIIKCPGWIKNSDGTESIKIMLDRIYKHDSVLTYINPSKVKKIIYINNNLKLDDKINETISQYDHNVIAMNLIDFWQKKFDHLM